MSLENQISEIIKEGKLQEKSFSNLGFFSKPIRYKTPEGSEKVLKVYTTKKNYKGHDFIIGAHDKYVQALRKHKIKVPETEMMALNVEGTKHLVIIQEAFQDRELIRNIMENGDEEAFFKILKLLLDDVFRFILQFDGVKSEELGFHPTTRNYAIREDQLFYFDTFPPMQMGQKALNRIIIDFAPVKLNVGELVPSSAINRVSDEYYEFDKMILGIIGSACRLRPELKEKTLKIASEYIERHIYNKDMKSFILKSMNKPPKLDGIWVSFRKLFGKEGKPNV